jgi:3-hydroxyisobutyrate dehydrogenase
MRVTFLGLGRMGVAMAGHLLPDHELTVWNRSQGKAGPLVERGAREAGSAREAVEGADAVVLMLYGPPSVQEVLPDVVAGAPEGALLVNCTTVGPSDAHAFAKAAAGLHYVDAPVAGTVGPATEGTLGVLGGASEADWEAALPLLHAFGAAEKVRRVGAVGAGSAMKLCNNLALGFTIAGVGEALRLGRDLGLDRAALLEVLAGTPLGGMVAYKRPMLDSEDYSEPTFSLDLLAKDLGLAVDAAESDLPVTRAIRGVAKDALDAGHAGEDFAALAGFLADEGRADSY